jgi:signal transduction histidine kinase/ligand-binding sensor domain-containing protein
MKLWPPVRDRHLEGPAVQKGVVGTPRAAEGWILRLGMLILVMLAVTGCQDRGTLPTSRPDDVPLPGKRSGEPGRSGETPDPGQPESNNVRFGQISLEQGLSQSSVFCIAQDRKGFMWFGTQDGLNQYDGYSFHVYKPIPGDPDSLSDAHIRAMVEDQEGILWIGTNGGGLDGLDRDTGEVVHFQYDPGDSQSLSDNYVNTVYEDSQGVVWIGTASGLDRLDRTRQRFVRYQHSAHDPSSLSRGAVQAIYEDREGVLWIGTAGGGLNRFDGEEERFVHYQFDPADPSSLSSNMVVSIYQDSQGVLWVGTDGGGLDRFERSTERFIRYQNDLQEPHSLSNNSIQAIQEDRFGTLWIGTLGGGLNRFDRETGQFTRYRSDRSDPRSLGDDWIWSLYEDRSGALWIGTLGAGISILDRSSQRFVHYESSPHDPDGLSDNFVWSIHQDEEGVLWLGTLGGGLDRFDRRSGDWSHYRHDPGDPHSLSHNVVRSIQQDAEGVLWIGTEGGGLDRFIRETGRFTHYRYDPADPHSLSSNDVLTVYVDRSDTVWVGTWRGLNKLDRATGRFVRYQSSGADGHGLSQNTVRSIYEDWSGALWIGTEGGLNRLDRDAEVFTVYTANPEEDGALSSNTILSMLEDQSGTLWIGTHGGGLNKFDRAVNRFVDFSAEHGLPSDVVYGILEDEQGFLWLSTNQGVCKFDPRTETCTSYSAADGLQSQEFNAGAFTRGMNGEMFFGGVNGFNAFHPESVASNPFLPPIVLTSLRQGGEEVSVGGPLESMEEVTFRWPANYFEFEYAALSYLQPEKNQYAYMLEGFREGWNYAGTRRFGRYTNLPGGTYTLRVKGTNNDGVWNEEGLSVRVTIVPPFWASWWFRLIVSLVVVGGGVAAYRLRVQGVEARTRTLEGLVQERTQEIERRRQELEALYRADEELHRHLSLDEVLQALVDIAVDLLQADKSSLMVWDEQGRQLAVRVARGFHRDTLAEMVFFPEEGTVGRVAASGKPIAVEDTLTDPRVAKRGTITGPEKIRSYMQVPIKVGGEVFGVFSADYGQPRAFGPEEKRLFLALAQRAALAIDTAQLYEQSQELAVVEERSRLARDLHDAVTQTLFSASLISEALPELWESDQEEGHELLRELRQLSRGALAEMRTLLLELRPATLTEANLADLLRQLGEAVTGRMGVPVTIAVDRRCVLPPDVHVALYRIAQEALNNVVKHANAHHVEVRLRHIPSPSGDGGPRQGPIELQVRDDGRGFDPGNTPTDRLGLGIIQERAQAIGAKVEIESQPGAGTRIGVTWKEGT